MVLDDDKASQREVLRASVAGWGLRPFSRDRRERSPLFDGFGSVRGGLTKRGRRPGAAGCRAPRRMAAGKNATERAVHACILEGPASPGNLRSHRARPSARCGCRVTTSSSLAGACSCQKGPVEARSAPIAAAAAVTVAKALHRCAGSARRARRVVADRRAQAGGLLLRLQAFPDRRVGALASTQRLRSDFAADIGDAPPRVAAEASRSASSPSRLLVAPPSFDQSRPRTAASPRPRARGGEWKLLTKEGRMIRPPSTELQRLQEGWPTASSCRRLGKRPAMRSARQLDQRAPRASRETQARRQRRQRTSRTPLANAQSGRRSNQRGKGRARSALGPELSPGERQTGRGSGPWAMRRETASRARQSARASRRPAGRERAAGREQSNRAKTGSRAGTGSRASTGSRAQYGRGARRNGQQEPEWSAGA